MAGKRTERIDMPKQLRIDDELAANVRSIAQVNRRPIGLQILHWIDRGVESDLAELRQAASVPKPAAVRSGQVQSGERKSA